MKSRPLSLAWEGHRAATMLQDLLINYSVYLEQLQMHTSKPRFFFLGRFRGNIPIALTLIVRLPENVIIVSLIMAPRPQKHLPFKSLYICMYRNFVGALQAATFNRLQ